MIVGFTNDGVKISEIEKPLVLVITETEILDVLGNP